MDVIRLSYRRLKMFLCNWGSDGHNGWDIQCAKYIAYRMVPIHGCRGDQHVPSSARLSVGVSRQPSAVGAGLVLPGGVGGGDIGG